MFYTKTNYIFCLYFRTEQANSNLLERLLRNKLPKAPLTVGVTSNDSEERASAFTDESRALAKSYTAECKAVEDRVRKGALHRLLAPMRTSTSTLLRQACLKMVLNKET